MRNLNNGNGIILILNAQLLIQLRQTNDRHMQPRVVLYCGSNTMKVKIV